MSAAGAQGRAAATIRREVIPVSANDEFVSVVSWLGDASVVLIGEASHGTHEFYAARARITQRLIEERGFTAVAIEGDWPDAYRVNEYVRGGEGGNADDALAGFQRFPTWMWRNTAVAEFVAWLHRRNGTVRSPEEAAGFYGLDLYSLHASMQAVVDYLQERDPSAAKAARESYACFDQFGGEASSYAWAASMLEDGNCEDAVTRQLILLSQRRSEGLSGRESADADAFFSAKQNARLARNAERYYRTMVHGRAESWNIRDTHMAETLDELLLHLERRGQQPKVVVWAHNSHLGDARATQMGESGEINLGQLVRERHGSAARLIGLTTYTGTVVAATDWGDPAEVKQVKPALAGSFEELFHQVGLPAWFLPLTPGSEATDVLLDRRLERAIGVVYRPDTERQSHYFQAHLASQFDAVVHFDETRGVIPLDRQQPALAGEPPETFPTGT